MFAFLHQHVRPPCGTRLQCKRLQADAMCLLGRERRRSCQWPVGAAAPSPALVHSCSLAAHSVDFTHLLNTSNPGRSQSGLHIAGKPASHVARWGIVANNKTAQRGAALFEAAAQLGACLHTSAAAVVGRCIQELPLAIHGIH
jgi:hypothetical protein